ncbi:methylglyoxal synthase [Acuticoccus sp. MNP-M23]|uniref:methylglyoxal synthase n=1 Tax=Acuticoccus sp. MNP-M23 TaxID=3072793 RepID=UPI002815FB75|nr:methylglyoxal synthase [Acuticoccus sp. MNP-M23]WMS43311.1 methylglyoxal synthase [Acuticoccus sp. MNP-M23]
MEGQKRIGLAAHDAVKVQLGAWAFANEAVLSDHVLTATGNTGRVIMEATNLDVTCLRAGTLGGDLELGALVADNQIDILILFSDPLTAQPHDVDPAPLLRIATIAQIAVATTETTADFIIRSELLSKPYFRRAHDASQLQPAQRSITQRKRT